MPRLLRNRIARAAAGLLVLVTSAAAGLALVAALGAGSDARPGRLSALPDTRSTAPLRSRRAQRAATGCPTSFAGGDGQVGIHGTNRPSVLGRDVSHGCIRVRNAVITRLARLVPLGTPVEVRRA